MLTPSASQSSGDPLFRKEEADKPANDWTRWWPFPWVCVGLAVLAFTVDLPVARLCFEQRYPRELRVLLDNIESFGDGYGAAVIAIAALVLAPDCRRWWIHLLGAPLLAGAVANLLKFAICRHRPRDFDLVGGQLSETFFGVFATQWRGLSLSFPSAHTTTAFALAVVLSRCFPRGRWLFLFLAIGVAAQRVQSTAHFLSDTLVGAAVGWSVAVACWRWLPPRATASRDES